VLAITRYYASRANKIVDAYEAQGLESLKISATATVAQTTAE
jgi:hypothetical protein